MQRHKPHSTPDQRTRTLAIPFLTFLLCLVAACSQQQEPQQVQEDPCPNIALDKLAGDWIRVYGSKGDHKNRLRIVGGPDSYEAYLVPGFFSKIHMKGEKRDADVKFTQVMTPAEEAQWRANQRTRFRLYVEPYKRKCSLRVIVAEIWIVNGNEVEKPRKSGYEEFLPFPEESVVFTFLPADGPLFLGAAAKNRSVAEAQIAKLGEPDPSHRLGKAIPVGVFTRVSDDGDPSCKYDMDLYFDDKALEDRQKLPASPPKGGFRHWYVPDWFAPYSGNHMFEIYRYRSCGDGKRVRIGINAIEGVLG